ncbi:MAG TPA: Calx-beta domain-containing protein [Allosphingosinicella sp.]|nr:Calx-beta domain-containing protein [Allosphingosinicella sp.]
MASFMLAASLCALATAARGNETTTYSYDELGRLVATSKTGTVNAGQGTSILYDAAGNRMNYSMAGGAAPAPPAFSVSDASVTEGGILVFTVTKTGATSASFSVDYATAHGTAGAADYSATSGSLTFTAGETSKTVSVATTGDTLDESNETLSLNLSNASGGATISDAQGIGTIIDDDDPPPPPPPSPPVFAIGSTTASEGSNLIFTVTKSGTTTTSYSVSYATSNGTAVANSDYYPMSGTLTFSATQTSRTVSVGTIADGISEPSETVLVTLSNPSGGATLAPQQSQATGTISDPVVNNPPNAVLDSVSIARCTAGSFNVIANDSDPEGDIPLLLTSVGGPAAQLGYASLGSSTNVAWTPVSTPGTYNAYYDVKDSRNASSIGTLRVTVTGINTGSCP